MPDGHDSEADRVLRTIFANSSGDGGGWVSKREVYLHLVAHADMETAEVDQALQQLRREEQIDVDGGRYRPVEGVARPKYPGEK